MKKTALAVLDLGTPRKFARSSMDLQFGVSTFSIGFSSSGGGGCLLEACHLAVGAVAAGVAQDERSPRRWGSGT